MREEKPERLTEGSQADDGTPYAVLGKKPPPPCPGCKEPLEKTEPICPKCNFHRKTGKIEPREYAPFDETWEAGVSLRTRLIGFLICQVLNFVFFYVVDLAVESLPTSITGWVITAIVQAFVLGTYDRVRIVRTRRGKVTITKTWRGGFIPLGPTPVEWRGCEAVGVRRDDIGMLEWFMLIQLLMYGIIPGILWWWYVIRTDRHAAALLKDQGSLAHTLYAGTDAAKAEEIAETVHKLTGLPYNAVA